MTDWGLAGPCAPGPQTQKRRCEAELNASAQAGQAFLMPWLRPLCNTAFKGIIESTSHDHHVPRLFSHWESLYTISLVSAHSIIEF
jgi:hypothetical protein